MRVEHRIPPYRYSVHRVLAKVPNPPPKTAGNFIKVQGNCLFRDLKAKAAPPPKDASLLPPLLPNRVGRYVSMSELMEMKTARLKNPHKWTITALSNHYGVARSYVIKNVLTDAERKQADDEVIDRINDLNFEEKRGWLMKYKIREHRRNIW